MLSRPSFEASKLGRHAWRGARGGPRARAAAAETFELEEQTGEAGAEESCLAFNNSQLSDCLTF